MYIVDLVFPLRVDAGYLVNSICEIAFFGRYETIIAIVFGILPWAKTTLQSAEYFQLPTISYPRIFGNANQLGH